MADLNVIYKIAADISGLKSGVDRAAKATEGLQSMAAGVGKALTAAFTVGAVLKLGNDVLTFAGNLADLSAQTGISTTGLQKFDLAFSKAGITMDTVAAASARLATNLVGGDKSTVAALTKLGLSVKELKTLAPEDQFLKVADAIGQIENPTERAYAAMQIFGKGGVELLKGLDGQLAKTIAQFEKMGLVVDEKTIQQIDDFGDQMGVLGKQIIAVGAEAIGPLMPMLGKFMEALIQIARVVGQTLTVAFKLVMTAALGVGTTFELLIADILAAIAKIPGSSRVIGDLSGKIAALRADAQEGRTAIVEMWTSTDQLGESATQATPPLIGLGAATEDAEKAARKAAAAQRDYNNWLVMREFEDAAEQIKREAAATAEATRNQEMFNRMLFYGNNQLETMTDLLRALEKSLLTPVGTGWLTSLPNQLETFSQSFGSKMFAGFGDFLKTNLVGSIQRAFEGGGDVVKSLGSAIGGWFTQAGGEIEKAATKGLSKIFGKTIGEAIGSIVPAFGTLLGPLAEKIGGWFKNLFGGKEKETNKIRQEFVDMSGGLGKLNEQAAKAGVSLTKMLNAKTPEAYKKAIDEINAALDTQKQRSADIAEHGGLDKLSDKAKIAGTNLTAMLDAKTPEAYKKAIDDLNAALKFQDDAMETLDATVKKYGLTIEELGPTFAKQQLHKRAQELYQDFQVLAAAGVPVVNITKKMGQAINEFVQNAIKTGTEVPDAMKPMLQAMIDNGQLVDANGKKYENLEQTGLSFSKTMTQSFKELIATVDKLTQAIARGLGLALENLPDEKNIDVNVNVNRTETTPHTPGENGAPKVEIPGGPIGPTIPPHMLTPGELLPASAMTGQMAAGATLQPSAAGVAMLDTGNRVNVDLTMNIDGVFSEGDLVSTIQRRVVPIIHETWNANVAGTRTNARDVLGVA